MNRIITLCIAILAAALGATAQVRSIGAITEARARGANESTRLRVPVAAKAADADAALYADVERRGLWYEGIGPKLTEAAAAKLPLYFRLSMRNGAGRWQYVQALCGGKPSAAHHLSPYALDKDADVDSVAGDWQRQLRGVVQWMLIPDADGRTLAEERAYRADGNLVYSFVPVRNADGRITGSYSDDLGLPVDMRPDSTATYGSVVWLRLDESGRVDEVDFLDGRGMRKYSPMGVDRERLFYDADGRLAVRLMLNVGGQPMRDRHGNAGYRYVRRADGTPTDTLTYTVDEVLNLYPRIR